MAASIATTRKLWAVTAAGALCGVVFIVAGTRQTSAAEGGTYLQIAGMSGAEAGGTYKHWMKIQSRQWIGILPRFRVTLGIGNQYVTGPAAPFPGHANRLAIAMDKHDPDTAKLMKLCTDKVRVPELKYAEPTTGKLPQFPDYFEYKLKDVQIGSCDVVPDAPEQAFVISFNDIEWTNYSDKAPTGFEVKYTAADIPDVQPAADVPSTKTFLVTWFGWATLGDDSTCPVMNSKPPESDYYALLPKAEADAERARRGEKGVSFGNSNNTPFMEARGPNRLNVCAMPGIVRDPGSAEPQTTKAMGVNLDANDGSGAAAPGTCKHKNFVSEDGDLKGVDNQLFRVFGCIPGYRGKKGYMNQTHNARRADGNVVSIIQVSGIDNPMNDDDVEIRILNARDKPMRDSKGNFIANYSFRMTDDPNFAKYNLLLHGKIVNGYVVTPSMKKFVFNNGQGGIVTLDDAQFRLKILPSGDMHGVVGGYTGWRGMATPGSSYGEGLFNFSCPGIYNAFKRNADGERDPITGQCNAISMAYEIDAVPAFVTAGPPKTAQPSQAGAGSVKAR